jgi:succinylglutamate desuccinylase
VFRVVNEIVKRTAAFRMALDTATPNFSSFKPGENIAEASASASGQR